MDWNVSNICSSTSSPSSVLALSNQNQVLGMASPQVSPSIRDNCINEGAGNTVLRKRPLFIGDDAVNIAAGAGGQYYSSVLGMMQQFQDVGASNMEEIMMVSMVGGGAGPAAASEEAAEELMMMKKRRLSIEQVRYLETSFEVENKLEPERKAQIAKELGLQPRQVAVWFQNRRARSKSKQLERDYNSLKAHYNAILHQNQQLRAEVEKLRVLACKMTAGVGTRSEADVAAGDGEDDDNNDDDDDNNVSSTSKAEPSTSAGEETSATDAAVIAVGEAATAAIAVAKSVDEAAAILTEAKLELELEAADNGLFYEDENLNNTNFFIAHHYWTPQDEPWSD